MIVHLKKLFYLTLLSIAFFATLYYKVQDDTVIGSIYTSTMTQTGAGPQEPPVNDNIKILMILQGLISYAVIAGMIVLIYKHRRLY